MTKEINLMIVEDHALTRIGLKTALEENSNLKVIAEAEYGQTAIDMANSLNLDVILMDLGLPDINGIEATQAIKEANQDIKIIILTSHSNDQEVLKAFIAGADAYCLKDIKPDNLTSIIQNIAQGGVWLDPAIAKIVLNKMIKLNNLNDNLKSDNLKKESPLTDREHEVLQLLADGLNNIEIAKKICISQYTVKAHIGNILQKLSVDDRTQAVVRAMREGWIT